MWQRELVWELKNAKSQERKEIFEKYSAQYGISVSHLYRIAGEYGFKSGRKERSDKGKTVLNLEQKEFVGAFIRATRRENKGCIAPVENALEFAIDNGIITRNQVSVGTVQRNLRELQMNKKCQNAATPHTELRSLHPNHVHEVDVSTCIQYYLDDAGLSIMREDEFYKNKLENFKKIKTPLQRYILEDHFSGFLFVKYYVSSGETAENLFDFLCSAWEAKSDSRFALRGAPKQMLMDGGCRAKAKAMGLGFWDGLDIEILPGKPGNSRRQGGVETHHNIWEMWFETRLRIDPATTPEDLNRKTFEFCLWFNATRKHTRHGMTRLSCWLLITAEQLRDVPERPEMQDLLDKPEEERTVCGGKISFQGKEFSTRGLGIPANAKVMVIKNLMKWKDGIITVAYESRRYEIKAIEKLPAVQGGFSANAAVIGQEYKARPETPAQKAAKRMDQLAYGSAEPNRRKETPFYGLNAFEGFADKVDNLAVMPKRGTAIELQREEIRLPITEAFKRLKGHMTPQLNRDLREAYGETIEAAELERVVAQIIETGAFSRAEAEGRRMNAEL